MEAMLETMNQNQVARRRMRRGWIPAVVLVLGLATTALAAPGDVKPLDPLSGDWRGGRTLADGGEAPIAAQVISRGNGEYRLNLLEEFDTRDAPFAVLAGAIREDLVVFPDVIGQGSDRVIQIAPNGLVIAASLWNAAIRDGVLTGTYAGADDGTFRLTRTTRPPPTLGEPPPADATVLFDGSSLREWKPTNPEKGGPWRITEEGVMEVVDAGGSQVTFLTFRDHRIHLEFRLPFMPQARGQGRANSGVYVQSRYEIQILDSYGLEGRDNECGGIYRVARPQVNMCAPPGEWQTYDIDFEAARFDGSGKKIRNARLSVEHNGVTIHDRLVLPGPTPSPYNGNEAEPGGLLLQDHGNPVQFRNIWVVEQ